MSGFDTLQEKLIQAKAVMDKVDGKPSNTNNINRGLEESNPNLPPVSNNFNTESINNAIQSNVSTERPVITEDKVKNSNLPDAIKQLMIDHPIPEVSFGNQIPSSLIEGAAEKMRKLSNIPPSPQSNTKTTTKNTKTQKLTQSSLKNLVRETIKESLDELIDERISERMVESNGLKESIKLVVGNTIFEGKILTTKKIK
jgi:hypothetical protein